MQGSKPHPDLSARTVDTSAISPLSSISGWEARCLHQDSSARLFDGGHHLPGPIESQKAVPRCSPTLEFHKKIGPGQNLAHSHNGRNSNKAHKAHIKNAIQASSTRQAKD